MDKNRGEVSAGDKVLVGEGEAALVICADPLAKAAFLDAALAGARSGAVYVDFDLMYSGHVASGLLPGRGGVEIIAPERGGVREAVGEAIARAAQDRMLVIVDSINGALRACGGQEQAAWSALMMLASLARGGGSAVLMSCTAVLDPKGLWRLSPVGGRLEELGIATRLYVRGGGRRVVVEALRGARTPPGRGSE